MTRFHLRACVPLDSIVDLTNRMREDGTIDSWTPPAGKWKVMRFGYMSSMATTGGGLQCDKYSADAARVAFKGWLGEMLRRVPDGKNVIKVLNVDSYEGGSLNWSPVIPEEFRSRRGYDFTKYLPCMAGVMVQSASATEGFLLDLRRTLSECLSDNHFGTLHRLAHENGLIFMSESVNQAFNCDDMEYFKNTDWPGGEFWVSATQNWKPNDIADPVSAARMYGKKIIFAEAWTGGRWDNHPFALKAMGDHHYAEGLNRMMLHVWNAQYYPKRLPGQPGAGTPFNMLNTWWKPGKAWLDYLKKAQVLLQQGQPVEDALYFSGENIRVRALLPPKLGWVWAADPPMPEGYKFATINHDAILNYAKVQNGRIVMSGLSYRLLVLRANEPFLTPSVALKIKEMVEAGAIVVGPKPTWSPSLEMGAAGQATVKQVADQVWGKIDGKTVTENRFGKGRVFWGKPMTEILAAIGVYSGCPVQQAGRDSNRQAGCGGCRRAERNQSGSGGRGTEGMGHGVLPPPGAGPRYLFPLQPGVLPGFHRSQLPHHGPDSGTVESRNRNVRRDPRLAGAERTHDYPDEFRSFRRGVRGLPQSHPRAPILSWK